MNSCISWNGSLISDCNTTGLYFLLFWSLESEMNMLAALLPTRALSHMIPGDWKENVPYICLGLNTWSPVGVTLWGCYGSCKRNNFAGQSVPWCMLMGIITLPYFCLLSLFLVWSSSLSFLSLSLCHLHYYGYLTLWTHKPKWPFFFKPLSVLVFYSNTRSN